MIKAFKDGVVLFVREGTIDMEAYNWEIEYGRALPIADNCIIFFSDRPTGRKVKELYGKQKPRFNYFDRWDASLGAFQFLKALEPYCVCNGVGVLKDQPKEDCPKCSGTGQYTILETGEGRYSGVGTDTRRVIDCECCNKECSHDDLFLKWDRIPKELWSLIPEGVVDL